MCLISQTSWMEMQEYLERDDRVLLPLGAVEEHGRHLGLGTDMLEADAIARRVSLATNIAVAPTLAYGMSMQQTGFSGTLSLRPTTLIAVLEDLLRGLYHHGFRRVLIVNGHGGNYSSILSAIYGIDSQLPGLRVKLFEWWKNDEVNQVVKEKLGEQSGSHAAMAETSFMMAICPEGVKLDRLTGSSAPIIPSMEITTVHNFRELYPDGIMGIDPAGSNPEAGNAILDKAVEICVRELQNW